MKGRPNEKNKSDKQSEVAVLTQQTTDKLYDLRLKGMAKAYQAHLSRADVSDLSFDERLGLLVDQEWHLRQERRTERRLKDAKLKQAACVEDIDFRHPRGLDRHQILDLVACNWIRAHRNLILTGPTGLGKTWIANALCDKACREGFTAKYARVPMLAYEVSIARADGSLISYLKKLSKTDVLVLDDWGLTPLTGQAQHDLLEIVDDRVGTGSTIVTSQLPTAAWHETVADASVADALLDRLLGSAIKIEMRGESLRK